MKEKLGYLFKDWKTIPNLLSFLRILLIPVFAVLFAKGYNFAAMAVLAISGLSDLFDGKIARRFNQVSELGKILDPIADKLTIATVAIIMYLRFRGSADQTVRAFAWVFLLFILKDMVMLIGGAFMLSRGMRPGAAEIFGKAATMAFYIVMVLIMVFGPDVGALRDVWMLPQIVMIVLVVIAVILTFVAFASYLPSIYDQFSQHYHWGKYKNGAETEEK